MNVKVHIRKCYIDAAFRNTTQISPTKVAEVSVLVSYLRWAHPQARDPCQHICGGGYDGGWPNSRRRHSAERNDYQVPVLYSSLDARRVDDEVGETVAGPCTGQAALAAHPPNQGLASARRKSLSRLMTPKQFGEANNFFDTGTVVQQR